MDSFTVTARVKESYSLWRKALKLGAKSIQDVPDALALRIIVGAKNMAEPEIDEVTQARDILVCYLAHMICSESFKPLDGSQNSSKSLMKDSLAPNSGLLNSSANISQNSHPTSFINALEVMKSKLTTQHVYIFLVAEQPSHNTGSMHRNGKLLGRTVIYIYIYVL